MTRVTSCKKEKTPETSLVRFQGPGLGVQTPSVALSQVRGPRGCTAGSCKLRIFVASDTYFFLDLCLREKKTGLQIYDLFKH